MNMKMTKLILAVAVSAIALPVAAQDGNSRQERTQREGGSERVVPQIAPPPAGMGQVVFYRSSRMGALISCRVHENGAVVNRLPPGRYFIHQTTPGAHEYSVRSEARDVIRVEVEEGETQFVRCAVGMGIGVGRPNLSPQSLEDFQRRGRGLDLQPPFQAEQD
jgi:hypothetical protein